MKSRSHAERLKSDLAGIRSELVAEIRRFKPDEIDWTPAPGMKNCRALVQEIAVMEQLCIAWAADRAVLDWGATLDEVAWAGSDVEQAIRILDRVRSRTSSYLDSCSEEQLETLVELPDAWHQYFGGPAVEPEEVIRWIARHEYYHLGQLIIYRWSRGDDPHQRGGSDA